MGAVGHRREPEVGFGVALRRMRDPILLFLLPVSFAALMIVGYSSSWPIGFDYRGTLWEPGRALLDGMSVYPEPTRDAVVVGNPAVYPPLFVLVSLPFALLPVSVASWLWFGVMALAVLVAMWILGVRDRRCLVLAIASPMVVQGLYYGNLTVLLVLPLALAWRYRDRPRAAGLAVGVAVAAKLFLWPLAVWLLLTRRFRAAAWAVGSSVALTFGAWAVIGFEGLADYPDLLRVVQDVYAVRSISLATVAGALGASTDVAVALAAAAGLALLLLAAWVVRRDDGDRRAFALVVTAALVATPIVWPNYAALLLVPVAVVWPRLSPAWFFGYVLWVIGALSPKPEVSDVCCRPDSVPVQAWAWSHTEPVFWYAAGMTLVVVAVGSGAALGRASRPT